MDLMSKTEGPWIDGALLGMFSEKTGEWRHQRPVTRERKCSHCGVCLLYCPCGCIDDPGTYLTANLAYCKGCGICAQLCRSSAIVMVREEKG